MAQCDVTNVSVELNSSTTSGGNCIINFDLTFNLEHNNGNKYIWIHLWPTSTYPAYDYTSGPPDATDLSATVGNIGINNNVTPAVFLTSYTPAPAVPVLDGSDGLTVTIVPGTPDVVTITGITLTVPGACASALSITADVWSTQAQSQNAVHCFNTGIAFVPNDPTITGFKTCNQPRTLNIGIQTTSVTDMQVTYSLYKDDGDNIYEPGTDDVLVGGPSGPHTINSSTPYSATGVGYTGDNTPGENAKIWVAVSNNITSNDVISLFSANCAPLPVSLVKFTAIRNGSIVQLSWQTSYELNNTGFYVQRNIGGEWEDIGFVPTRANGGNSTDLLDYNYTDQNTTRGIIQYRLRQVDLDGKMKFSEVRAVRGEDIPVKLTIYPNPSLNGKASVVFDDAAAVRQVNVMDMNGRMIRQFNGVTGNMITIEGLGPGIYTIRVFQPATGSTVTGKLVVQER